jgi:hypothetical protein
MFRTGVNHVGNRTLRCHNETLGRLDDAAEAR